MSSPRSPRELSGTVESRKEPPGAARETWELSGKSPRSGRKLSGAARSRRELSGAGSRHEPGEPPGAAGSRQELT